MPLISQIKNTPNINPKSNSKNSFKLIKYTDFEGILLQIKGTLNKTKPKKKLVMV